MSPTVLLLGLLVCLGLTSAAPDNTCPSFNPVKYNRRRHLYTIDPFAFPATQPPNPVCAFALKGYEGRSPDLAGHPILHAKCCDKIRFVLRPLADNAVIAPAKAEEHGVYVLHNVKNESVPCPMAAECGTSAKDSVPCSKLGWGEKIMAIEEVDKTHVHTSRAMRDYVRYTRGRHHRRTTLFFGCPDFIDLGEGMPKFSHCQIGQYIKVVVRHPPGGCK